MKKLFILTMLLSLLTSVKADFKLNNKESKISYVSIKKNNLGENNFFKRFTGEIDDLGNAEVKIDPKSINSFVEIRDERLKSILFKANDYPSINITTKLPKNTIKDINIGEIKDIKFDVLVNIVGKDVKYPVNTKIVRLAENKIIISSTNSIIVSADSIGFVEPIKKLKEMAKLPSITEVVPVNFFLLFEK